MGMCGTFVRVSNNKLDNLTQQPFVDEEAVGELFENIDASTYCSIDKSWHTLHYLLSGTAWEGDSIESQVIMGGQEFGPDLGYGPARYMTAEQVRQVATAMDRIQPEDLHKRFDPDAMHSAGIYSFSLDYAQDELEFAKDYFVELKTFYQQAAQEQDGVVLLLT